MKFCVCIKQVPDVTAPIQLRDGELVYDTGRMVLNAYDASAVEEALVLTEKYGGQVDLVLIGPQRAQETIRKALAMGAERATHLLVPDGARVDAWQAARLLAAHLDGADYDVVACGKQAQDTDAGLTGSMLAQLLGRPYATNAVGLDLEPDAGRVVVTRQGDAGQEILALPVPCLVTCSNDMNDPRIPTLKGIMGAKRKTIDVEEVALPGDVPGRTEVVRYESVPEREPGRILEDEPAALAATLRTLLREEAKVL